MPNTLTLSTDEAKGISEGRITLIVRPIPSERIGENVKEYKFPSGAIGIVSDKRHEYGSQIFTVAPFQPGQVVEIKSGTGPFRVCFVKILSVSANPVREITEEEAIAAGYEQTVHRELGTVEQSAWAWFKYDWEHRKKRPFDTSWAWFMTIKKEER